MQLTTHIFTRRSIVTLAVLVLAAVSAHAQVGLGLSPMRLELRMAPGVQHSGTLNLTNNSTSKARIRTELLDFFIDTEDVPQFERESKQEDAFSCRQWLSINPMETELASSTQLAVRYTIRVPQGVAEGSYHCAAGFTTLPAAEQINGTGMRMAVRAVAAFYVVIGNPPIEGGLKEFKLERVESKDDKAGGWRAIVVMENAGLMFFRPTGKLEVVDESGKVIESEDFQSLPVLPKREQRFLFPLTVSIQDGRYTLRARVEIGTGDVQEGRATVSAESHSK